MKNSLLATLLFLSTSLSAAAFSPTAGDQAMYQYGSDRYLLEVQSLSPLTDRATIHGTLLSSSIGFSGVSQIRYSSLIDESYISDIRQYCARRNGRLETVTVPAGSFESCYLVVDGFEYWYGENIPVNGFLKSKASGSSVAMELISTFTLRP